MNFNGIPGSALENELEGNDPLRHEAAIVCQNLGKRYNNGVTVLSDLNMKVPSGSVIWTFIEELASIKKTTIIITTHYIEEARRANMIGVMGQGRILAEQPPQKLIENTNASSLEKAVSKLLKSDLEDLVLGGGDACRVTSNNNGAEINTQNPCSPTPNPKTISYPMAKVKNTGTGQLQQSAIRIKALTYKNFIVMIRNILLLSFVIWVPAAEVFTVDITYNFNPRGLKVGIINQEANKSVCDNISVQLNCSFDYLSCQYLAIVNPDNIEFVHFDSTEDAEAAVNSGWLTGYLKFPPEISESLFSLATSGPILNDSSYNSSIVIGRFDETNKAISASLKLTLFNALENLMSTLYSSCDLDPRMGKSPLQYESPVYGKSDMDFREYTCPSVAIV
ncbi:unnamed protein product [Orchesella dallaii]|uniref:ABC transporter G family member 23 n=1 Tax=Orchesella dallaii TaxID=48710 RepID=A0ABP1Q0S7_9HEXA